MGRPKIPFDQHYIPVTESGCWLWTGGVDADGYGTTFSDGRAHRVAYKSVHGSVPAGMLVCHRCDVPSCVNPAHLFLGTAADNSADMTSKQRQVRGSKHYKAKLTDDVVSIILRSDEPCFVLAQRYRTTDTTISLIRLGKTWKHVPRPEGYSYKPYRAPGNHAQWETL